MWLESALCKSNQVSPSVKVKALNGAGLMAYRQGDYQKANAFATESLALSRMAGDKRGTASALCILGLDACRRGDYGHAEVLCRESLGLCQEMGDKWGVADSFHVLGLVARDKGDHERAVALLEQGLMISRTLGDRWSIAIALTDLGLVVREQGDYARAAALIEESLGLFRMLGRYGTANSLSNLATVAWLQGKHRRAAQLFAESLVLRKDMGDRRGIAVCLVGLAAWASQRQPERAARLFGAAEALRESLGVSLPPFVRGHYDRLMTVTRARMDEARFKNLWMEGRTTPIDQVIGSALAMEVARASVPRQEVPIQTPSSPLTHREQEVALLVARGFSNREIASTLRIAEKTAATHVQNILNKLGFNSRAQIASWAASQESRSPIPR